MHCMSALQPAVPLHVVTALVQSLHLDGMQEHRSKAAPSVGGGAASWGGGVVVEDVDVDEVDVELVEVMGAEVLVDVTTKVVAVDVVDVERDVWTLLEDDGGLPVTVETAEVLAPSTPFAGSPPSAAHDVAPKTNHAAYTSTPFRPLREPVPSRGDVRERSGRFGRRCIISPI
jgi:hypothetical protein